jgi:hypothetical protein
MDFIKSQSKKFNNLVLKYFITNYKLQKTNYIKYLESDTKNVIFIKDNFMIISNSIINYHYKTNLDENKYSLVCILYKNLYYREKDDKQNGYKQNGYKQNGYKQNICYLDYYHKNKINYAWSKFSKNINLDQNTIVISRKYYNKQNPFKRYFNCFELLCFQPTMTDIKKRLVKNNSKQQQEEEIYTKNLRRKFLYNLKSHITDININSMYLKTIINKSLFLDIEYINDIYDDFTKFPISKDNSLLCMIGMYYLKNDTMNYDNLVVKRLNNINEYYILKTFLDKISNKKDLIIFHWSNADKLILEKSLIKYTDLWEIYSKNKIIYVDLLQVVKNTIPLKSYSLKYVSKVLLKYTYETECKNGLDAMCSIILNDNELNKNKIRRRYKSLNNFKNMNDIIQYNKIDTRLLYVILQYFIDHKT